MSRYLVSATWDDAPHLGAKEKAELVGAYPVYQRDARTKGVPQLGSGAIYPIGESEILVDPFDIPVYWPRGYGMDVGWNMNAAIFAAHDRETDVLYLTGEYMRGQAEPPVHAAAVRLRAGDWMNGVIDPAARGRGQKDGSQLLQAYRDQGLKLHEAMNAVEAGIYEVYQRLSTGRLKVFRTMQGWLGEYRIYRRDKKGAVVKEGDHAMDATRYLVLSGLPLMTIMPNYLAKLGHGGGVRHDYDPINGAT